MNVDNDLRQARLRAEGRQGVGGTGYSSQLRSYDHDTGGHVATTREASIAKVWIWVDDDEGDGEKLGGSGTAKRNIGEPFNQIAGERLALGRAFLELGLRLVEDAYSRIPDEGSRCPRCGEREGEVTVNVQADLS